MAPRDDWTISLLADQGAYRGEDYPWDEQPSGPLLPPPRNPAQEIPQAVLPGLSRPYGPRAQATLPESGKVPTSDPWTMGALADAANLAGYAIPGPAAAAKAAPLIVAGIRRALPAAEEAAGKGIRAYHSSPHDFERFDASKIGTGEGAQVYGHGIYFAENPAVSGQGGEYWKAFANRFGGSEGGATERLRLAGFDREKALKSVADDMDYIKSLGIDKMFPEEARRSSLALLQEQRRLLESDKPVGPRTYEVNIKARPEEMLDWDKAIADIPREQQRAIRREGVDYGHDTVGGYLGRAYRNPMFAADIVGKHRPAPSELSVSLAERGIPGIRYLDQGSRALAQATPGRIASLRMSIASKEAAHKENPWLIDTEKNTWGARNLAALEEEKRKLAAALNPTSNYVIFPGNEHLIDIMKKYGIAGAAPAGLGAMAAQDQYAQ